MASGKYSQWLIPQKSVEPTSQIPLRSSRQLSRVEVADEEFVEPETELLPVDRVDRVDRRSKALVKVVDEAYAVQADHYQATRYPATRYQDHPLDRFTSWLRPLAIIMGVVVIGAIVLISASVLQRPGPSQLVLAPNAQVYSIQVGGSLNVVNGWDTSNGPLAPVKPIPHGGPYSVLGSPTLSVDFMNQVLAYYHSPAAGKAQALYDDGIKYGLDPAFALAFFMHESTFGTAGVARVTLSLSNMRCVPAYPCFNQNGGYAQFSSWEQGFEAWFKLIRNLYIAQWGLVTIDQIIPVYAPSSDHNDVSEYIATLKHTIDTWHAGIVQVT